jgi:hypothetical protein
MNTDTDQAQRDLDQARETHAAALVARRDAPSDPDAARRVKEAVRAGRDAWSGYRDAATAGLAAQIEGIVPGEFAQQ